VALDENKGKIFMVGIFVHYPVVCIEWEGER
jgi:hypothetical protein